MRASVVEGCTGGSAAGGGGACSTAFHRPRGQDLFDLNQKYADVIALDLALAYLHQWQAEAPKSRLLRGLVGAR